MKTLIAIVALASLAGSPALANSARHLDRVDTYAAGPAYAVAGGAYAQAPAEFGDRAVPTEYAGPNGTAVYSPNGDYLGADPDPSIRLEMHQDSQLW